MKKIILAIIIFMTIMSCHNKKDGLRRVLSMGMDLDALYQHPENYIWIGVKGDDLYFFRAWQDNDSIDVYYLPKVTDQEQEWVKEYK